MKSETYSFGLAKWFWASIFHIILSLEKKGTTDPNKCHLTAIS
jgi:hypothetical protein